jgi:hypothetical protein
MCDSFILRDKSTRGAYLMVIYPTPLIKVSEIWSIMYLAQGVEVNLATLFLSLAFMPCLRVTSVSLRWTAVEKPISLTAVST